MSLVLGRRGRSPPLISLSCTSWGIPSPERPQGNQVDMVAYYRKFIPNLADKLAPWTRLLKKGRGGSSWSQRKEALIHVPVLRYPDFTRQFVLTTDASGVAIGAVMSQVENGEDRPVADASRKLTRYSAGTVVGGLGESSRSGHSCGEDLIPDTDPIPPVGGLLVRAVDTSLFLRLSASTSPSHSFMADTGGSICCQERINSSGVLPVTECMELL
ncbi:hypothetical protein AAG570_012462 [Ranatra chinensis]|uniref:Reverse transcriptase/retrotransposon-derived protein RNase H-like domain-containing protein n=1 Tax=Ranatra chinensis TaxID=642074 RepID=A0ABD0YSL3_9HEMI